MIPNGVIQVRADICNDCKTPCENRPDITLTCSKCPINKWSKFGACGIYPENIANDSDSPKEKMQGLGDLVAKIAQPIAKFINLDPKKCGCAKRQAFLNEKFPFSKK